MYFGIHILTIWICMKWISIYTHMCTRNTLHAHVHVHLHVQTYILIQQRKGFLFTQCQGVPSFTTVTLWQLSIGRFCGLLQCTFSLYEQASLLKMSISWQHLIRHSFFVLYHIYETYLELHDQDIIYRTAYFVCLCLIFVALNNI